MAFFIRSAARAALTFAREQLNFTRAIPTGVFTGLQVYHGTAATYRVSLYGGVYCINGIVIYDDADQTDIFDLGAPGADEHHLIYVTYDPDTDVEPTYATKAGTYAAPATLTPTEAANGFVIADVWMPTAATDITDAVINNRSTIESEQSLVDLLGVKTAVSFSATQVVVSGSTYTLHWDKMRLLSISANKEVDTIPLQWPFVTHTLTTATPSSIYVSGDDYEITYDAAGSPADDYIFFYVVDPLDFTANSTLTVRAVGHSSTASSAGITELGELLGNDDGSFVSQDFYPYRPNLKNTTLIAVVDVDNGWVHYANGVAMPVDEEFDGGTYSHYGRTVSSTVYGTGPYDAVAGDFDLDLVFDNVATLFGATLDHVYDGFLTGSINGHGRSATIDAGAMDLSNVVDVTPIAAVGDQWNAALRIGLDTTGTGDAGDTHALSPGGQEKGIDVYSDEIDSTRLALINRRVYHAAVEGALEAMPITLTDDGNLVKVTDRAGTPDLPSIAAWHYTYHDDNQVYGESRWVTFPSFVGGNARYKVYRLRYDLAGSYYYLETVDGVTDIDLTYGTDFNFAGTIDTTMTVWEIHNQIGQTSIVQDLEVQGGFSGPGGKTLHTQITIDGYDSVQDLIEDMDDGGDMTASIFGLGAGMLNPAYRYMGQGFSTDRLAVVVNAAGSAITNNTTSTDGRYVYIVESTSTANPAKVKVYNARDMSLLKTVTTTNSAILGGAAEVIAVGNGEKVAICFQDNGSGDPRAEVWDIEDNTMDWGSTFATSGNVTDMMIVDTRLAITLINTTTDQMFCLLAMSNGALVTDSTAGNLNFAKRADDAYALAAHGQHMCILSDATGASDLTILDPTFAVVFDGYGLVDIYNAREIAMTPKHTYIYGENSGGNFLLWQLVVHGGSGGVVLQDSQTIETGTSANEMLEAGDNYVIVRHSDGTNDEISVRMEDNISAPIYYSTEVLATRTTRGLATDGHDYFLINDITNAGGAISLGKKPGMWTRVNNRVASSQFKPFFQYLAMPLRGW